MTIYKYKDFYELLKNAKKPIAYVAIKEPYDSLQVAPVGCFGSYSVMPCIDNPAYVGESFAYDYSLYDTAFETDFDDDDLFAVLDDREVQQAIEILKSTIG